MARKQDKKARRSDAGVAAPAYTPSIAARSIDGHLLRTAHQVFAWYRLQPQRWSFRSDQQREGLVQAIASQYADLQGRWMHLRVTNSPYPIRAWAQAHAGNVRDPLPDVDGTLSFDDYLEGEQDQLAGSSMVEKEVYLGVQVQTRTLMDRAVETASPLLRHVLPEAARAELAALDAEVEHLDQVLARVGLQGRPVTASEVWWLMHRSCALGLPAPQHRPGGLDGQWETEDLASFTDVAEMVQEPYAPTVTVRGTDVRHADQSRNVAILSLGRQHDLQIPQVDPPWMQQADQLGAPVEWSARIYVRRPEEVSNELHRQANKVRSQERHYEVEHGLESPLALQRQQSHVVEIDDEMTSGFTALATRVRSWWRVAVSGRDQRQALARAQALISLYDPKTVLEHPEGQHALAREFVPGEPLGSQVHARRGSVVWAASAVPQATAEVGDRRGVLLGQTAGATRRPVAWDPWRAQEIRDASGLTALAGGLGSGKSFLGAGLVYKTLRAGARWTVLDPSGPLSELCKLPELKPFARPINLLQAQPGILNPYRVVREPQLEDFADEADPHAVWREQVKEAHATRRRLVQDVLLAVLPLEISRNAATKIAILEAVQQVGGDPDRDPGMVIEALPSVSLENRDHAVNVKKFLDEVRERLRLLIPTPGSDPYVIERDDRLTVLSMAGLTLPKDGTSREDWTDTEALGVELLNLAAWLTQRQVYERPKSERKGVWIDEAFFLSQVPTGRVLMNRFSRDSRKWNVRVLLSSQIPQDFLNIQQGFASLLDSVFVGRLDDEEIQADALRLLKVPTGIGYEDVLTSMGQQATSEQHEQQPRQFLFNDGAGGVERLRVDFGGSHLQHLREALDTTPGQDYTADEAPPAAAAGGVSPGPARAGVRHDEETVRHLQPLPGYGPSNGNGTNGQE